MKTCATFALYNANISKSASLALEAKDPETEAKEKEKRWDFLRKFNTNFDHWCVSRSIRILRANLYFSILSLSDRFSVSSAVRIQYFSPKADCHSQSHLDVVQYVAASENGALLPLVTRLMSIKTSPAASVPVLGTMDYQ